MKIRPTIMTSGTYNCHADCSPFGCQGHSAALVYHEQENLYELITNGRNSKYFNFGELQVLIELLCGIKMLPNAPKLTKLFPRN